MYNPFPGPPESLSQIHVHEKSTVTPLLFLN